MRHMYIVTLEQISTLTNLCVCVCMRGRERERERLNIQKQNGLNIDIIFKTLERYMENVVE